ncbi:MAG: hypothetical protein ACLSBH_12385 [Coprobacillus cateniformis]
MNFIGTFWALIPAIIAIVIALKTKEVYISLFIGIFVGVIIIDWFSTHWQLLKQFLKQ